MSQILVGTLVHYRPGTINDAPAKPYRYSRCIPAVITRDFGQAKNLVVFTDGSNDLHLENVPNPLPIRWETSVSPGPAPAPHLFPAGMVGQAEWHHVYNCEHKG